MILNNLYFRIWPNFDYARCARGLYEGGKPIHTTHPSAIGIRHHDVMSVITTGQSHPTADFMNVLPEECFSERAFDCFQRARLDLWEFEWVPVRILRQTGEFFGKYYWPKIAPMRVLDALDYEHAKYEYWPPSALTCPDIKLIKDVGHWVLNHDAIGSVDIFRCHVGRMFVSKRFKEVVEANNLRGFEFESVETWVPE